MWLVGALYVRIVKIPELCNISLSWQKVQNTRGNILTIRYVPRPYDNSWQWVIWYTLKDTTCLIVLLNKLSALNAVGNWQSCNAFCPKHMIRRGKMGKNWASLCYLKYANITYHYIAALNITYTTMWIQLWHLWSDCCMLLFGCLITIFA